MGIKYLNPLRGFPGVENIKKFGTRKDWKEAAWRTFVRRIAKTKDVRELSYMLAVCVSRPERTRIVRRVMALARLIEGKSYRAIGRELWLAPQTISAIKKGFAERQYKSKRTRGWKKKKYTSDGSRSTIRMGRRWRTKYGSLYW